MGSKNKEGCKFFNALASIHPGLSLEVDIDIDDIQQVAFGYVQSHSDIILLQDQAREIELEIKDLDSRRKNDFDIRLDVYLDEAYEKQKIVQKKQEQLAGIRDALAEVMQKNEMDPSFDDPADWAEIFE